MTISVFELYSIGIGPSSSHTIAPMRAAKAFVEVAQKKAILSQTSAVKVTLYGSLAHTGIGHGTLPALFIGLTGAKPETVDPKEIEHFIEQLERQHTLELFNGPKINFNPDEDCLLDKQNLIGDHSNSMRLQCLDASKEVLLEKVYYSIGGGFIIDADEPEHAQAQYNFAYPFETAKELLALCDKHNMTIAELMFENEKSLYTEAQIRIKLSEIKQVMFDAIDRGCETIGTLPGILKVPRRAPSYSKKLKLKGQGKLLTHEQTDSMDWLNVFAIAVNEENAAGGRVVTAPTNGAAGIIPAVMKYLNWFYPNITEEKNHDFLLTAAAIGVLYKKGASISGAEVGCQGEVGVASSMAAGAITALLGGSIAQVEQAAEIAMEHHLGMTCDPVAGLVQIPCIERNAMGAVKAVNASRLALLEDGQHKVSLDQVIKTMRQTGKDMMTIYKETSLGGLAVNISEC